MAEQELRYRIVAQDDMTVTLEKVRQALSGVETATESVGNKSSTSFAMAGIALNQYMEALKKTLGYATSFIEAFAEQEKNVIMLDAAINASGHSVVMYGEKFRDLAKEVSNTTFATQSQIMSAERTLLQYGISIDKVKMAITALGNYSLATGRDMESVTMRVAYAMSGMTDNLHRVGIPVELKGVTDEAERLDKIVQAINTHWPNMTGMMSGTAAMQIHQARNEWNDFKEILGSIAWDIYGNGVTFLTDALKQLSQYVKAIKGDIAAAIQIDLDRAVEDLSESVAKLEIARKSAFHAWYGMSMDQVEEEIKKRYAKYRSLVKEQDDLRNSELKKSVEAETRKIYDDAMAGLMSQLREQKSESDRKDNALLLLCGFKFSDIESIGGDIDNVMDYVAGKIEQKQEQLNLAERISSGEMFGDKDELSGKRKIMQLETAINAAEIAKREKDEKDAAERKKKRYEASFEAARIFANGMAELARAQGKSGFEAYKVFAIAEATVSAAKAAIDTFTWIVPRAGPVAAGIAAAGIAASLAAQIQQIASMSYEGGGGGGGASAIVPSSSVSQSATGIAMPETGRQPSGANISITVSGFVGSESLLASELGKVFREAVNDNVDFGLQTSTR